jgi:hypothetical protein
MVKSPPDDFQLLLERSIEELRLRTAAHAAWGLGKFARWDVDQESGDLVFSNTDGTTAVAPVQIIGTFDSNDGTWLWAWDNPSIAGALRADALKVKDYGTSHGIDKLTTRKWSGTQDDAWAMTALATTLCGAEGAYRGPAGSTYIFMTFGEVKVSKRGV